jgi:hypothetical protein
MIVARKPKSKFDKAVKKFSKGQSATASSAAKGIAKKITPEKPAPKHRARPEITPGQKFAKGQGANASTAAQAVTKVALKRMEKAAKEASAARKAAYLRSPKGQAMAALRAETLRKQRNAASKISRLRTKKGVEIAGTQHDPRVDRAKLNRYNARQLNAHMAKLDAFTDRAVAFVPGVSGTPLPLSRWKQYKTLEEAVNAKARARDAQRKDIAMPGGMTLGERKAMFVDGRVSAAGDAVFDFIPKTERKSVQIKDLNALDKFIKLQQNRLDEKYVPKKVKEARGQMDMMLTEIGNTEFIERAKGLSDYQFDLLWQDAGNVNQVSLLYWITQQMATGRNDRQFAKQIEDNTSDIHELFQWAESQPKTPGGGKKA